MFIKDEFITNFYWKHYKMISNFPYLTAKTQRFFGAQTSQDGRGNILQKTENGRRKLILIVEI